RGAVAGRGRVLLALPLADPVRAGGGQAGPQGDVLGHRTRAGVLAGPRDGRVPAAGDHAGVPGECGLLVPAARGEELMRGVTLVMLAVRAVSASVLAAPCERKEPPSENISKQRQPREKATGEVRG